MENAMISESTKQKWIGWLKKSGIVVFLLFLGKGLIWLGVAFFVWMGFHK